MNRVSSWVLPVFVCGAAACGGAAPAANEMPSVTGAVAGSAAAPAVGPSAAGPAAAGPGTSQTTGPAAAVPPGVQTPSGPAGTTPAGTGPGSAPTPTTGPGASMMPVVTTPPADAANTPDGPPTKDCEGFPLAGLKYSPGGEVLPNKCKPFHPTTNNPYAVRCTDAWPFYKTKYAGDNVCILPPPPDKGVQYGVHPQGTKWYDQVSAGDLSGYNNVPKDFELAAGGEENKNYYTSAAIPKASNFYRNYARMRPGSHHMIVSTADANSMQGQWGPGAPGFLSGKNMPGAQRPDENNPKSLEKPMEDDGYYMSVPANPGMQFNMHHFNATDNTILKEAWTNLWWETDARTELRDILGLDFGQTAGLAVQPDTAQDLHYSWPVSAEFRMVTIFGHRHAWTTNFSSWIAKGGMNTILYQSYNWLDEPTYRYDSQTMNPVPAPEKRTDGAASGIVKVPAGSTLHFNCHIEYTEERAKSEGAPSPKQNGTLRFANEAFTAEMCILFGQTVGTMLIGPSPDNSALPDFAKK